MKIEMIKTEQIVPYDKNPRNNDNAVPYVKQSIEEFGFKVPIILDKNNVIVCGHTRYKAAVQLGMIEIPCVYADDLTEQQIKAFRIADNKVSEFSNWDFEQLANELNGISELDMSQFGFFDEAAEQEIQIVEDDFQEEVPEEPFTKRGQVWILGEHRLMCGDSTSEDDVKKLMQDDLADLVVTDPPYNVNVSNSKGMKIENDNMERNAFKEFLTKAFHNLAAFLREGGAFYVWLATKEWIAFETALNDNGLFVRQELIWNKNAFTLGRQDYQWKHEPCMYGWKEGKAHYFIDCRNLASVIEDVQPEEIKKMKKDELVSLLEELLKSKENTTVIDENKPTNNDLHPTMKPLKLIGKLIKNSSRHDEVVLDLFGGSGSTLIAAEQLGRKARLMEYDPKYADVIIKRWEEFTGKKAQLLN